MPKPNGKTKIILGTAVLILAIAGPPATVAYYSGQAVNSIEALTSIVREHRIATAAAVDKLDNEKLDTAIFRQAETARLRWEKSIDAKLNIIIAGN